MIQGPPAPQVKYATVNAMLAAAAHSEHGLTFVDLQEKETSLSYRQLYQRARRAAHVLIQLGVRPGDRVAIGMPTSPHFMDALFGTLLAGAVPAPLYPSPRVGRLDDYYTQLIGMLQTLGTRLIIADAYTITVLQTAAEAARPELGCRMIEELLPSTAVEESEVAVSQDALGLIQFSSGSTSTPKGIALPHRSLVAQAAMVDFIFDEGRIPEDKMVTWLPLYHDMGLIGCLLVPMYMQIPIVIMAPDVFIAEPRLWLRAISRHGGTLTVAPNFAYELCMRRVSDAELEGLDLRSLRQALNGSEPVSATLMEAFSQRFGRCGLRQHGLLRPVYGLAEATLAVTHPTTKRSPVRWLGVDSQVLAQEGRIVEGSRKLTSVGGAMPGVCIEIRDKMGNALPERRVGGIFFRTMSPMKGYFNNPQATVEVVFGDWLYSGDLGFIDDGELFICGRAKDLIIIRGANHAPQHFEDCLDGVQGVRMSWVAALGFIPDGSESEELLILAERAADLDTDDPVVVKRSRKAILQATGIRPHTIVMLPKGTLRRTSSGKIRRQDALQRFLSGEFTKDCQPPQIVDADP